MIATDRPSVTADPDSIRKALENRHYETARRLSLQGLAGGASNANELRKLLHLANLNLGDFSGVHQLLDEIVPVNEDERLEITLLHATDYVNCTRSNYWRESPEVRGGMSQDEFSDKMLGLADKALAAAIEIAKTEEQRRRIVEALIGLGMKSKAEKLGLPVPEEAPAPTKQPATEFGIVSGVVKFADGKPAAHVKITLGLELEWKRLNPAHETFHHMNYKPFVGPQEALVTETDANGAFRFDKVPAGVQEFIAASLDPAEYDIPTRFLAQQIDVKDNGETTFDLTINEWTSAPAREVPNPFATEIKIGGIKAHRILEQTFKNPFYFTFPRQLVRLDLPEGVTTDSARLALLSAPNAKPEPIQVSGRELLVFLDLPEKTDRILALYELETPAATAATESMSLQPQGDGTAVADTGRARFRVPLGSGNDSTPPLISVQGPDGVWRGKGRFRLPEGVSVISRETRTTDAGPLVLEWTTSYQLSNGAAYEIRFTAHRNEAYLLAHEISPDIEGASFEFSLSEFSGGRGYLHWTPEREFSRNWSTLRAEEIELARLQESVAWWIPTQGFAYAMTVDGLEQKDYVSVFSIRRGDWIDRKFEKIIQGPKNADGTENRELDWPFCEMVGSTISMITAQTDKTGDAYFKFGFFDGERHWGILVSDFGQNDGPFKELSSVQHKNSSPRLQDFKDWRLDEPDHVERPYIIVRRDELKTVRKRIEHPVYEKFWNRLVTSTVNRGSSDGIIFAVKGDPVAAWRKKRELFAIAAMQSKMTLLGRDFSDMYSPVGGRQITPWAEEYDLIAASGVFTSEEEREVRNFLLLMGHLYMSTDMMNWRYNSRNANFEADRVDVVSAVGLAFHGNPDADKMVTHAAELMEKSINVYSTPGSGKWYENPACYYLHASKCRLNLAFHLASHGIQDPTLIPRMKDFLRWGVLLLTPQCPHDYDAMRDGLSDAEYRSAEKVRRLPPIGDHAHVGTWVPDHYATMSKWYRKTDPEFADLLLWAYQQGGSNGGYYGNAALIVANMDETELAKAPQQALHSRRLEGFGAIFRGNFGKPDEFYLLFKQGPGGYRYHRTEGSIVLFADGKPLIYDGGEAGETWRHTTLSFHDVHMPLACGHVERFHSFPGIDFCQGVHPLAVEPGGHIQANDPCHHTLVPEAWRRFAEPDPANVRTVLWIKNEYVVLHDDLHIDPSTPSYWHLQAVAQSETGNAAEGYVFKGRFGTDLQVTLPGQRFLSESCVTLPILEYYRTPENSFAMRHLQLQGDKPNHYLAVLRPLSAGKAPLQSVAIEENGRNCGVSVQAEGIRDTIFISRSELNITSDGASLSGRYATVVRRPDHSELSLIAGSSLEAEGVRIESSGPAVFLTVKGSSAQLAAQGTGTFKITFGGKQTSFEVTDALSTTIQS